MPKMTNLRPKLLVIDDLKEACEYLKSYFERRNYIVFTAETAEEALDIVKEENPDLMLVDMNLPKMSGVEFLKAVRKFNTSVKAVMVSAYHADFVNGQQFKELDILEFMHKPVGLLELELIVKKAIA